MRIINRYEYLQQVPFPLVYGDYIRTTTAKVDEYPPHQQKKKQQQLIKGLKVKRVHLHNRRHLQPTVCSCQQQ